MQGILHPEAELASARAAGSLGVPFIMSSASTRSIEEVAQANGEGSARKQDRLFRGYLIGFYTGVCSALR